MHVILVLKATSSQKTPFFQKQQNQAEKSQSLILFIRSDRIVQLVDQLFLFFEN